MLKEIIVLILITLTPLLELRASIPYGILVLKMNWWEVFLICAIANIILVPLIWLFIFYTLKIFLRVRFINNIYERLIARTQRKVEPYIKKYGKIGLALFIGVPLPGSGVISGGLGAYLLGFKFKDYLIASVIGVLIAGIIVTLAALFGSGLWNVFIKA